jgi:hypothetical protein
LIRETHRMRVGKRAHPEDPRGHASLCPPYKVGGRCAFGNFLAAKLRLVDFYFR